MENTTPAPAFESVADDILRGAGAIASFLGEPKRRVFYLAELGLLPIGKEGKSLIASKKRLCRHYDDLTRGVLSANGAAD
jgi:hypothetical protein